MRDFVYAIDKCQNFQHTTNITSGHTLAYLRFPVLPVLLADDQFY